MRLRATKDGITGSEFAPLWRDKFGSDEMRIYRTASDVARQVMEDLRARLCIAYARAPFAVHPNYVSLQGVD